MIKRQRFSSNRGSRCLYTADQPEVGNQQVHGYSGPKDFAHFTPILRCRRLEDREYRECELEYRLRLFGDGE